MDLSAVTVDVGGKTDARKRTSDQFLKWIISYPGANNHLVAEDIGSLTSQYGSLKLNGSAFGMFCACITWM